MNKAHGEPLSVGIAADYFYPFGFTSGRRPTTTQPPPANEPHSNHCLCRSSYGFYSRRRPSLRFLIHCPRCRKRNPRHRYAICQ